MKHYTGIGSRKAPPDIQLSMKLIAIILDNDGYTLRSGGAKGADTAFESGSNNKEIYLPWKNFNNNKSELYDVSNEALYIASKYHPYWNKLGPVERMFHGRNVYQILGKDLDKPSEFVICWTPDGTEEKTSFETGGTGQAIRIAVDYDIPVKNLNNSKTYQKMSLWVKEVIKSVRD